MRVCMCPSLVPPPLGGILSTKIPSRGLRLAESRRRVIGYMSQLRSVPYLLSVVSPARVWRVHALTHASCTP